MKWNVQRVEHLLEEEWNGHCNQISTPSCTGNWEQNYLETVESWGSA